MEELPTDLKEISAEEVSVSLLVEELPTDLKENSAEEVLFFSSGGGATYRSEGDQC